MLERRAWIGLFTGLLLASPGLAQEAKGNAAAGKNVAQVLCSDCHQVASERKPRPDVPGFAEIAKLPSTTALSIQVFLLSEHLRMSPYHPTRDQVDNVIAFILSLKK